MASTSTVESNSHKEVMLDYMGLCSNNCRLVYGNQNCNTATKPNKYKVQTNIVENQGFVIPAPYLGHVQNTLNGEYVSAGINKLFFHNRAKISFTGDKKFRK